RSGIAGGELRVRFGRDVLPDPDLAVVRVTDDEDRREPFLRERVPHGDGVFAAVRLADLLGLQIGARGKERRSRDERDLRLHGFLRLTKRARWSAKGGEPYNGRSWPRGGRCGRMRGGKGRSRSGWATR